MAEPRTALAVALLSADVELRAQLREALSALGAHIVHEGSVADVSRGTLEASGADVVVVNLEAADDAHLDHLYDELDGGSYQLVFNDAEASRGLVGWDKARWARHLAAKLVGSGDVDPPRPADTRFDAPVAVTVIGPADDTRMDLADAADHPGVALAVASMIGENDIQTEAMKSGQFEAELQAFLDDDATASAKNALSAGATDILAEHSESPIEDFLSSPAAEDAPKVNVEQRQTVAAPAPVLDWDLVDMEFAPPVASPAAVDSRQFGIEKISAADYLKPEGGDQSSTIEPGIKLELVSLEEAVAPTMSDQPVSEMLLGEGASGVRRVVAVGAGLDGTSEVGAFLAGLPTTLPALVLLVQHQHDQHAAELAAALDTTTRLPVHVARHDSLARHGQVWLVPAGQQCRLGRDGRIKLADAETSLGDPSIDQCLTHLAGTFGADVTAVILAGPGHDALAGAQDVRDHDGRVWIQDPEACGPRAMVATIHAEGLATFVGSPLDLARRLCEEYA